MFSGRSTIYLAGLLTVFVRNQRQRHVRAKLMWILSYLRQASNIGLLFAALACFAVAKLPEFANLSQKITESVNNIDNPIVRTEMIVPIFLTFIMSPVVKGLFVAGMIAASISTLDTYFLSWSGIFVQDVVSPLKKTEITGRLSFETSSIYGRRSCGVCVCFQYGMGAY